MRKEKKSGRVTYLLFSFPFSHGQASLNILVILKLYLYSNLLEGLIKPRQLGVYIPSHPPRFLIHYCTRSGTPKFVFLIS